MSILGRPSVGSFLPGRFVPDVVPDMSFVPTGLTANTSFPSVTLVISGSAAVSEIGSTGTVQSPSVAIGTPVSVSMISALASFSSTVITASGSNVATVISANATYPSVSIPAGAVTLVGTGSTFGFSSTVSFTPSSLVAGTTTGDVVIACVKYRASSAPGSATGWTLAANQSWDVGQPTERGDFFYTTGDTALSYTVNGGSNVNWVCAIAVLRGAVVVQNNNTGGFDSYTYPSLSGILAGSWLVHLKAGDFNSQPGACPAATGFTQQLYINDPNGVAGDITIHTRTGVTGTYTGQNVGNDKGVGHLFEVGVL